MTDVKIVHIFYVKKYLLNIIKNNMDYENTTIRKWQILSEKPRF